jgi:hypothetical protein
MILIHDEHVVLVQLLQQFDGLWIQVYLMKFWNRMSRLLPVHGGSNVRNSFLKPASRFVPGFSKFLQTGLATVSCTLLWSFPSTSFSIHNRLVTQHCVPTLHILVIKGRLSNLVARMWMFWIKIGIVKTETANLCKEFDILQAFILKSLTLFYKWIGILRQGCALIYC